MFDYQKYLKISRDRMINALLVSDYGTLTEKLMRWENKGFNNKVWKEAPSISAGANNKDIDIKILDEVPYTIMIRDDSSELINKLMYEDTVQKSNGGKKLNYERKTTQELLALLTIPIQFSILEYFEFQSIEKILYDGGVFLIDTDKFSLKDLNDRGFDTLKNGRIDFQIKSYQRQPIKKRVKIWEKLNLKSLSENDINLYQDLSNRRNELIHEVEFNHPDTSEAINYFENCREIASKMEHIFNNNKI